MDQSSAKTAESETPPPKATIHVVEGVNVYARGEPNKAHANLDAIDQDEGKIKKIADILFRRGFGVMRQRSPRGGKVFYIVKATWSGPGGPPRDPFENNSS
jgi:hypothetical protein